MKAIRTTRAGVEHCHCGAVMSAGDHCPCCACEAHEKVCDSRCNHPRTRSMMVHSDKCWEGK